MCGTLLQDRYVQDERYVAGAGMRRSDFFQVGIVLRMLRPEHAMDGFMDVLVTVQN